MAPRPSRLPEEADLGRLGDIPRAEAIRIAMIKHGWDAATAAKRVDGGAAKSDEPDIRELPKTP